MNLLDKLERKFGRYAIHNLMYYIIILYALGYVIVTFVPQFYVQYLSLDPTMILRGRIQDCFISCSACIFIILLEKSWRHNGELSGLISIFSPEYFCM